MWFVLYTSPVGLLSPSLFYYGKLKNNSFQSECLKIISGDIGTICSLTSWSKFLPWMVAHKATHPCISHTDSTCYNIWFDCYSDLKLLMELEKALILQHVLRDLCLCLDADRSQIWKVTHNYSRTLDFESPNNNSITQALLLLPTSFRSWFLWTKRFVLQKYWIKWPNMGKKYKTHSRKLSTTMQTGREKYWKCHSIQVIWTFAGCICIQPTVLDLFN